MIYTSFNRIIQLEYNDNKLKKRAKCFPSILFSFVNLYMYSYVQLCTFDWNILFIDIIDIF